MNKFRARRKAKEQQQTETYSDSDAHHGLTFGFGKQKKSTPESKPVIDLATALPSTNDLRTSLIMPNLSARFSMLREQDDPSTKIGKANDDSVLFPKRASRLNLFGHNPLTDIAEVDSISDSVKAPFAQRERKHSLDAEGYDSDCGGSIMNRSRPGEGNNLFGGRQKLYKIPAASLSSNNAFNAYTSQPDSGGMSGRVMYENDVSLSLFQKYRQKGKEDQENQDRRGSLDGAEDNSPRLSETSFSKNRGTTSSTTSVPRRSSTAATSIESQSPILNQSNASVLSSGSPTTTTAPKPGPDRNPTIYRKMYGQALNQPNSVQRIAKDVFENLGRPRAATNDKKANMLLPVNTNSDLNESLSRTKHSPPLSNLRAASPPPSAPLSGNAMLGSPRDLRPVEAAQGEGYGYARPLSPPVSDSEDAVTLANSVQPEDRGKATAMGLFNKPSRDYDEHQFSQRQLQMHQGRISPFPHKATPTPASTPALHDDAASMPGADDTSEEKQADTKDVSARVASLIRRQNEELVALEMQNAASDPEPETTPSEDGVTGNTFLESEDELPSKGNEEETSVPTIETPDDTHPAFRPVEEGFQFPPFGNTSAEAQPADDQRPLSSISQDHSTATPGGNTLDPPSEGQGLSRLIRTHLRHDSDKSSICPPASPPIPSSFTCESPTLGTSNIILPAFEVAKQDEPVDAQFKLAQNARQFLTNATLLKNRSENQAQRLAKEDASHVGQHPESARSWQDEMQSRHHRGASTETQQEREDFNNELAERRRIVQERLRSVAESNSRSGNPVHPTEPNLAKSGNGFSTMLRAKSSRTTVNDDPLIPPVPQDPSSRAMKLLGLAATSPPNASSTIRPQMELWKEEEERMLEDFARRPKLKQNFGSSPTKIFSQAPPQPLSSKMSPHDEAERSRQRVVTPASTGTSARDRSTSDVSGHSRSRNGQYRDDHEKAMAGAGPRARFYGLPNGSNTSIPSRAPADVGEQPERSASAMSGRYRSESRSNTPGYFDSKQLYPLQPSAMSSSTSLSSRPSPRTPYFANSTPPIPESSSRLSHASTTALAQPIDGRSTPSIRDRKRSITKDMISDPTFVSTTYTVTTVDLPPGASLRNGSPQPNQKDPAAPAIPLMHPSRRRGRLGTGPNTTYTLISTLTGRANDGKADLAAPRSAGPSEERHPFSDEGDTRKPAPQKPRQKLRKVSSEGGDMNAKARFQALMTGPSPALPTFPVTRGPSPPTQRGPSPTMHKGPSPPVPRMEGGMF